MLRDMPVAENSSINYENILLMKTTDRSGQTQLWACTCRPPSSVQTES